MQKSLITGLIISGAVILTVGHAQDGDSFQPNRPQRAPAAKPDLSTDHATTAANPAAQKPNTVIVNVPVVNTEYVEESTPNGVRLVARHTISYLQREVPMPNAEETQRLRDELRELNGQKIDLLDSVELIEAVSRTKQEVAELQAWAKLVQIQADLTELIQAHEGTQAAQIASELLGRIPSQRSNLAPSVRRVPTYPDDEGPHFRGTSNGDTPRNTPDAVEFFK